MALLPEKWQDPSRQRLAMNTARNDFNQAANLIEQMTMEGMSGAALIGQALQEGGAAARAAMRGPARPALVAAREELRGVLASLEGTVSKLAAKLNEGPPRVAATLTGATEIPSTGGKLPGMSTIAQSMARIGGGGRGFTLAMPMLSESRRQTGLQKQMVGHLAKLAASGPPVAVFAR
jgi:hypothetical protein